MPRSSANAIQRQQPHRCTVDRHRRIDVINGNLIEQNRHVIERIDGNAPFTDFPGLAMASSDCNYTCICQIERNRQPRLPLEKVGAIKRIDARTLVCPMHRCEISMVYREFDCLPCHTADGLFIGHVCCSDAKRKFAYGNFRYLLKIRCTELQRYFEGKISGTSAPWMAPSLHMYVFYGVSRNLPQSASGFQSPQQKFSDSGTKFQRAFLISRRLQFQKSCLRFFPCRDLSCRFLDEKIGPNLKRSSAGDVFTPINCSVTTLATSANAPGASSTSSTRDKAATVSPANAGWVW